MPPTRLRALDGVRALAILAVMLHHGGLLRAGYFGVDAFFVLSGFLITTLLLREWGGSGAVSLRAFYRRRALRLFPALAAFLIAMLVAAAVADARGSATVASLHDTVAATLYAAFYISNFAKALSDQLPVFSHLWSLAEEEQFYLVWPVALVFLLRRMTLRRIALVLAGAAMLLAAHRVVVYSAGGSWQWVISSPDTRSDPLIVGCLAGVLWHAKMLPRWFAQRNAARLAFLACGLAVAAVVAMGGSRWTLVVGLVPFELAIAALILLVTAHPSSAVARMLGLRPVAYVGRISYSLYLWHAVFVSGKSGSALVVGFGLSFGFAALSYRYVEQPFLRRKRRPPTADAVLPKPVLRPSA